MFCLVANSHAPFRLSIACSNSSSRNGMAFFFLAQDDCSASAWPDGITAATSLSRLLIDSLMVPFSSYSLGEPKSLVYESIIDGVCDGKIYSQDGVFYVEKAAKYFPDNTTATGNFSGRNEFHSIMYKEAHVVDPYQQHRTGICPKPLSSGFNRVWGVVVLTFFPSKPILQSD